MAKYAEVGRERCQACLGCCKAYLHILGTHNKRAADLSMLLQGSRSLTSKRNPITCCLISCEAERIMYHQVSYLEAWWYTTSLVSQLIAASGGVSLRCGTLRTLQNHVEVGQRRCQACLGRYKACLHILGTHINDPL